MLINKLLYFQFFFSSVTSFELCNKYILEQLLPLHELILQLIRILVHVFTYKWMQIIKAVIDQDSRKNFFRQIICSCIIPYVFYVNLF